MHVNRSVLPSSKELHDASRLRKVWKSMHSKLAMKCVYSLSHRSRCRCSCDPLADWGKLEHGGCTDAQFVTESNGRISELSADIESSCCHSPSSQEDIAAVGVWTCHCAYSAGAQMNVPRSQG